MAQIIPLSEGSFTVDATKKFLPFDTATDRLGDRSRGSLLVEIQPFLVVTSRDRILLDTGLGFQDDKGRPQLYGLLERHGFGPGDITKVLISHLHKDHAGGIQHTDPDTGAPVFSFPGAQYYVNAQELDYAFSGEGSSYQAADFSLLKEGRQVVTTPGEGDIDGGIHYQVTGGHSRYHQVFWLREDGEILFFGGDVAPQLSQVRNRFIAKYDEDGRRSMELRQAYVEEGTREGWTFLFYHDIKTPFIRLGPAD